VEKLYEEENLTPKKILNEIGWKPDCCSCVNEMVELIMQEKKRLTDKAL
jgi:bacterioferritin-associated ferredoxin